MLLGTFVPMTATQRDAAMALISVLTVALGEGVRQMVTPNAKLPKEPVA